MGLEALPQIRYGKQPVAGPPHFVIPLSSEDRKRLPELSERGKTREEVRDCLEKAGFALKVNSTTGEFSLFDFTVPARALHQAIRKIGKSPRELASWLVGQKDNPLSKEGGIRFYAEIYNPRIEVGFFSLGQGETITEVRHTHPECVEAFIVTAGRVSFEVQGKEVTLDKDSPYYLVRSNTPHQLTQIEPGTEFIMLKRAIGSSQSPAWPRRENI